MRKTFVCLRGFQAPRSVATTKNVLHEQGPFLPDSAECGSISLAPSSDFECKRLCVETSQSREARSVTVAVASETRSQLCVAPDGTNFSTPERATHDALMEADPPENEEALQREVEEDIRLSTDIAFTPDSTAAAGRNTPTFHLSQPILEIEKANDEVYPVAAKLFHDDNSLLPVPPSVSISAENVGGRTSADSDGGFYDLSQAAQNVFTKHRGIKQLYPWQHEVLMRDDLRAGGSLVYSLPTSGGKTLVAEISLLRCLLNRQKSCFFVLPFVSLAEEKAEGLRSIGDALGFVVDGHYGTQGRIPLPKRTAVYVCTIEKANSVLNHMLEEDLTGELGAVVVDELHMLGESHRGATLELFLSKLLCLPHKVQLIGMSATIPNLPNIATWLRAACYVGQYRPIPLRQYAVVQGMVMEDGERNERNLVAAGYATETEQLLFLATEVPEASVLVFCASRQQCVDTARLIARRRESARQGHSDAKSTALAALLEELSSFDQDALLLSQLIPNGVAFHHGGLLGEERELIERAYRQRHINVLCCTSTLAAGVNLPARRVIFKTPYVGREFLTKSCYLQMCGRAGRAGLDDFGESFLLLSRKDCFKGRELMRQEVEPSLSQMLVEANAFERALLECVAVGVIRSFADGRNWMSNLLCNYASGLFDEVYDAGSRPLPLVLDDILRSSVGHLIERGLVDCTPPQQATSEADATSRQPLRPNDEEEGMSLSVTPFGACSVRSCFAIEEALLVREELKQLQQTGLILADDLHLCYFVTPLREIGDCNWLVYRDVLSRLNEDRQRIANMLGVNEFFVHQRSMGLSDPASDNAPQMFTTRRFFVALMLADLLSEVPMSVVEQRYQRTRGQLQSLMRSASMFSSSITSFCRAMGWFSLEAVLASFVKRLGFGVRPDIVPLMEIRGMQPARARALWVAGFKDPAAIAASSPNELLQRVKGANSPENKSVKFFTLRSAVSVIREANNFLQQHIREKKGELMELALRSRTAL